MSLPALRIYEPPKPKRGVMPTDGRRKDAEKVWCPCRPQWPRLNPSCDKHRLTDAMVNLKARQNEWLEYLKWDFSRRQK